MSSNLYKIVLLGDGAVGKTSSVHRFLENKFSNTYAATIGVDILNTQLRINGEDVSLNIWDLAGQEHFKSIRPRFYNGTSACILIFDVTNIKSFDNLINWIEEAKSLISVDIPMILVGNKIDLDHLRQIGKDKINRLKETYSNICSVFETSALTGEGINEVFQTMAEVLLDKQMF